MFRDSSSINLDKMKFLLNFMRFVLGKKHMGLTLLVNSLWMIMLECDVFERNPVSACPPLCFCCHDACMYAHSLQSCPTLRPHGLQPTRLLHPWDSPGKNTGVSCHFLLQCMHAKLLQSYPTLCNPIDSSPPGSSVHGILQARKLGWVAIFFSASILQREKKVRS